MCVYLCSGMYLSSAVKLLSYDRVNNSYRPSRSPGNHSSTPLSQLKNEAFDKISRSGESTAAKKDTQRNHLTAQGCSALARLVRGVMSRADVVQR